MTNLDIAKENLVGNTISLFKEGKSITSQKKGISPMMEYIEKGIDLNGFSVADVVVGKAVALLFVKAKIVSVFSKVISESALAVLKNYNIPVEYETLVPYIINRKKDGMCPMEKTVINENNPEIAYNLLKEKLKELKIKN